MNSLKFLWLSRLAAAITVVLLLTGCAGVDTLSRPAPVPESRSGYPIGYLTPETVPDGLALLPSPPAAGSVAFALDEEYSRRSFALRDTAVWELAKSDANLKFPSAVEAFSCALNAPITETDTPYLYILMRRTSTDAHYSVRKPKKHYQRLRPFLINKEPLCTPKAEKKLAKEGSYPSGHNTVGMVWSLILAELAPERADAVLARGRAYGLSRIVCNAHWYSDTLQGRYTGAYLVSRLHAYPGFRADLEAARAELASVRAKGLKPTRDCKAEAEAIMLQKSLLE